MFLGAACISSTLTGSKEINKYVFLLGLDETHCIKSMKDNPWHLRKRLGKTVDCSRRCFHSLVRGPIAFCELRARVPPGEEEEGMNPKVFQSFAENAL
jgi:hypothetical protein